MKRIHSARCRFTEPRADHMVHETIAQFRTLFVVVSFPVSCPAHVRGRLQHREKLGTHELILLISSLRAADCSVERERGFRIVVDFLDP